MPQIIDEHIVLGSGNKMLNKTKEIPALGKVTFCWKIQTNKN